MTCARHVLVRGEGRLRRAQHDAVAVAPDERIIIVCVLLDIRERKHDLIHLNRVSPCFAEHVLVRRPLINVADHVIILLRNVVASVADVIAPEDVNGWNALAEGELFGAVCAGCACDGSMVGAAPIVLQIDRVIRPLRPPIRECAVGVVPIPLGLRFCHIRRHAQQERDPFLYTGSVFMFCSRHFFTARRSRRVFLSIMHDFLKEKRSRSKFRLPRIVVHSICSHM